MNGVTPTNPVAGGFGVGERHGSQQRPDAEAFRRELERKVSDEQARRDAEGKARRDAQRALRRGLQRQPSDDRRDGGQAHHVDVVA